MTERMLDTSITATSFDPDADGGPLPDRAHVVIVGGGVIGSSIAYHLAGLGITDVVVLERHRIASRTSWHAASLVARVPGPHSMTDLADYWISLSDAIAASAGLADHF